MNNYSLFSYFSFFCKSLNVPTLLTLFRFILIPFICIKIVTQDWSSALFLFIFAAITDVFDGALARLTNSETALGACLDPLADKCLILLSFWSISLSNSMSIEIPNWFTIILLIKELMLVIGAVGFGVLKNNVAIKPSLLGKGANFIQSIAIIMLFIAGFYDIQMRQFLNLILFSILGISFGALVHYFWVGFQELNCEY